MRWRSLKLHYVLAYGILGAVLPYLPLYLELRGLSDAQIGWVLGEFGIAVLLAPPVLTYLADRTQRHRTLIAGCFLGAGAFLLWLAQVSHFTWILAIYALFCFCFTALLPLSDGLTFSQIEANDRAGGRRVSFPNIRIWGSVGFMLPAVALLLLLQLTELTSRAGLILAAGVGIAGLCNAGMLPKSPQAASGRKSIWPTAAAWRTLALQRVAAVVGSAFLVALAMSIFYAFYPGYLVEIGVESQWVGVVVNIGVAAEIVLMLAFHRLLGVFRLRGLMLLGVAATAVRLALLAAAPTIPIALVTQVLHGPMVLSLYVVPLMYLDHKADPSYRNSMQGLYAMLVFGVARLTGSATGGHIAEWVGDGRLDGLRAAMGFGAAACVVATAWVALVFRDEPACEALRAG